MWIRAQKRDTLINSDKIVRLHIKFGRHLYADEPETYGEGEHAVKIKHFLGEYDEPQKILDMIELALFSDVPAIELPENNTDAIKIWSDSVDQIFKHAIITKK